MGAMTSTSFEDRYKLQGRLGEGSFGQVRAAISIAGEGTPRARAVKIINLTTNLASTDGSRAANEDFMVVDRLALKHAKQEAKMWKKVGKHPNCIELIRTFTKDRLFLFVAERADASMLDRLPELMALPQERVARFMREMLLGVAHCHRRRVVHRDIKPENFLLCGREGTVKLCDFGLAARLPRTGGMLFGTHGTAPYMSVEMILDRGHDFSTDIWSLGVTYYVMLFGTFPYKPRLASARAMKQAIVQGTPQPSFEICGTDGSRERYSRPMKKLLGRMMVRMAEKRCTAEEAMEMTVFKGHD
jgi:serine/threonine protein kinase